MDRVPGCPGRRSTLKRIDIKELPEPARFVPYKALGDRPNIIVDGAPLPSTVLTLSHWPNNQSPPGLARDTSTETAFAYLDTPELYTDADIVSNNHFDEDGLFSMFCVHDPTMAMAHRELLIAGALAGDFGVVTDQDAARLCFVIESFTDSRISPLPADTFIDDYDLGVGRLYRRMLRILPDILGDLQGHEKYWREQDDHLAESRAWLADGSVSIAEYPELDLAIVRTAPYLRPRRARRYLADEYTVVHPFATNTATACSRIFRIQDRRYTFEYRYETWVQLATRRPLLRVDLGELCDELNDMEQHGATWCCDPADDIVPRLHLEDGAESGIGEMDMIRVLIQHLETAAVAWDPYDWEDGKESP